MHWMHVEIWWLTQNPQIGQEGWFIWWSGGSPYLSWGGQGHDIVGQVTGIVLGRWSLKVGVRTPMLGAIHLSECGGSGKTLWDVVIHWVLWSDPSLEAYEV